MPVTVTTTRANTPIEAIMQHAVTKLVFDWLTVGAADLVQATTLAFSGEIRRVVTVPGIGVEEPTLNYDVTLADDDGVDVLGGGGMNRSNVATEEFCPVLDALGSKYVVANSTLTLTIANAGAATTGQVIVYID